MIAWPDFHNLYNVPYMYCLSQHLLGHSIKAWPLLRKKCFDLYLFFSGIIRFCRPDGTGLQSLVGILYLPYYEIRVSICFPLS